MFKRLLYRNFRATYRVRDWVLRRFSRAGILVLVCAGGSALIGLDTRQTMTFQAVSFLLCLLIVSMASSLFFKARFVAERRLPRFGMVGERLSYPITVHNQSRKQQSSLLVVDRIEDPIPGFDEFLHTPEPGEKQRNAFDRAVGYYRWEWLVSMKQRAWAAEQPLPAIPPGGRAEILYELVPRHRGRLCLSGFAISRPDPFGLCRASAVVSNRKSMLILPKQYRVARIRLPGVRKYHPGGVALASSVGDSEEFLSMREYRPGDPLRHIHWKSWAKTGTPIVKEFQDEFFVRHALVLDTFQEEAYSERFEEAVSVAASFAGSIQTQDSLLDLMFVGGEAHCFTGGRGLEHTDGLLEILASVQPCRDRPFGRLPPLVLERSAMLSGCICVLLDWDEERRGFVRQLRARGVPALVLVIADRVKDAEPAAEPVPDFHRLEVGSIQKGLDCL